MTKDRARNVGASGLATQVPLDMPIHGELKNNSQFQRLRAELEAESTNGLLTTGQAAKHLGIKSVNTVKRWIYDGLLEGYRRGGRVKVSAASVAALIVTSRVAAEKAYESRIDEALKPLEALEDLDLEGPPGAWPGRKPWERDGPA